METSFQVLMRETPLEVLTRAASLVAGCETSASDAGRKSVKRVMSSECELQTNIVTANSTRKCRRVGEQDSPNLTRVSFEDESQDQNNDGGKKSAATQTLFSSFVPFSGFYQLQPMDPVLRDPMPEEEPCLILDLDQHTVKSSHPYHAMPPGSRTANRAASVAMETEINNSPLNLTVAVSSRSPSGSYHPPIMSCDWQGSSLGHCQGQFMSRGQPVSLPIYDVSNWRSERREQHFVSVKNEPSSSRQKHTSPFSNPGTNSFARKGTSLRNSGQQETSVRNYTSVETDPNIDEHFRRSLGSDYSRVVNRSDLPVLAAAVTARCQGGPLCSQNGTNAAVPPSNELPTSGANKSITGAVDEHFAKSLGSAWTKIKLENGPNNATGGNASAVDDHFAKALGETWSRLKAEKRSSQNSSCFV